MVPCFWEKLNRDAEEVLVRIFLCVFLSTRTYLFAIWRASLGVILSACASVQSDNITQRQMVINLIAECLLSFLLAFICNDKFIILVCWKVFLILIKCIILIQKSSIFTFKDMSSPSDKSILFAFEDIFHHLTKVSYLLLIR